jgi:hypothetical protein
LLHPLDVLVAADTACTRNRRNHPQTHKENGHEDNDAGGPLADTHSQRMSSAVPGSGSS